MGRRSKAAGSRFEKWLTDQFKAAGWFSDRLRSFQVKGEPDLFAVNGDKWFHIQAKERQNLNVHTVLMDLIDAQNVIGSRDGFEPVAIPIVVWKRVEKKGDTGRRMQKGPVLVALPLEAFLAIVGED